MCRFEISVRKKWAYHIFRDDIDTGYWYHTMEEAEEQAKIYALRNGDNYIGFVTNED